MGSPKRGNLASSDMTAQAVDSLGLTLGNFASRIKRKLKEQESRQEESLKETELRHNRILQALNIIRRALQETGQIQLGERFQLELDVSDWEGWPRLSLNLMDSLVPHKVDYALIVTAHDRKGLGSVELRMKSGALLGEVHLQNEAELEKIPLVLKKSVRTFLDVVTEYVLAPENPSEPKQVESSLLLTSDEDVLDEHAEKLLQENLFLEDDYSVNDNRVDSHSSSAAPLSFDSAAEPDKP